MQRVRIRDARLDDTAALLAIEEQSFVSDQLSRRQLRYLLTRAQAVTKVACARAAPVGYGILLTPRNRAAARLYSLAISAPLRGRGLAKQIIQALEKVARADQRVSMTLEVRASDAAARGLYEHCGFAVVASLPAYYANGDDGLRMAKALRAGGALSSRA